jgi:hypothetical protein
MIVSIIQKILRILMGFAFIIGISISLVSLYYLLLGVWKLDLIDLAISGQSFITALVCLVLGRILDFLDELTN